MFQKTKTEVSTALVENCVASDSEKSRVRQERNAFHFITVELIEWCKSEPKSSLYPLVDAKTTLLDFISRADISLNEISHVVDGLGPIFSSIEMTDTLEDVMLRRGKEWNNLNSNWLGLSLVRPAAETQDFREVHYLAGNFLWQRYAPLISRQVKSAALPTSGKDDQDDHEDFDSNKLDRDPGTVFQDTLQ
jgi:hypothetical protein